MSGNPGKSRSRAYAVVFLMFNTLFHCFLMLYIFELDLICAVCNKSFKHKSKLMRHLKSVRHKSVASIVCTASNESHLEETDHDIQIFETDEEVPDDVDEPFSAVSILWFILFQYYNYFIIIIIIIIKAIIIIIYMYMYYYTNSILFNRLYMYR